MDVVGELPTPSSVCSGVGCSAVQLEDKWGGFVVRECQLFLGLIPASVAHCAAPRSHMSCLTQVCRGSCLCPSVPAGLGWLLRAGGYKFPLKSPASQKSFDLWMNAKVHGPWSSLGWGCSCFSLSDLPSPALSLSYCNSKGDMEMPQPCPELS